MSKFWHGFGPHPPHSRHQNAEHFTIIHGMIQSSVHRAKQATSFSIGQLREWKQQRDNFEFEQLFDFTHMTIGNEFYDALGLGADFRNWHIFSFTIPEKVAAKLDKKSPQGKKDKPKDPQFRIFQMKSFARKVAHLNRIFELSIARDTQCQVDIELHSPEPPNRMGAVLPNSVEAAGVLPKRLDRSFVIWKQLTKFGENDVGDMIVSDDHESELAASPSSSEEEVESDDEDEDDEEEELEQDEVEGQSDDEGDQENGGYSSLNESEKEADDADKAAMESPSGDEGSQVSEDSLDEFIDFGEEEEEEETKKRSRKRKKKSQPKKNVELTPEEKKERRRQKRLRELAELTSMHEDRGKKDESEDSDKSPHPEDFDLDEGEDQRTPSPKIKTRRLLKSGNRLGRCRNSNAVDIGNNSSDQDVANAGGDVESDDSMPTTSRKRARKSQQVLSSDSE